MAMVTTLTPLCRRLSKNILQPSFSLATELVVSVTCTSDIPTTACDEASMQVEVQYLAEYPGRSQRPSPTNVTGIPLSSMISRCSADIVFEEMVYSW